MLRRLCATFARLLALALTLHLASCGSTRVDLDAWRGEHALPRAEAERGDLAADLARVDALRGERRLDAARELALALAAERPDDGRVLFLASRAESDALVLLADREQSHRDAAAASALDYARRADVAGERSPEARAQLAWALGASTHLEAMFDRSDRARQVVEVAEAVLAEKPDEPTALATLAIVHLRLETLPWIAKVMATGRPESSLEQAVAYARRAVEARPSRESRLILAKCLRAAGEEGEARSQIEAALAADAAFPRDELTVDELRELRDAPE